MVRCAAYNGFPFHFEMIGHIIEYCLLKGHELDVFTNDQGHQGWLNFYFQTFGTIVKGNHFEFLSVISDYKVIFLVTDDDKTFPSHLLETYKDRIVCIDHFHMIRNPIPKFRVTTRAFVNRCDPVVVPCFQVVYSTKEKNGYLLENTGIHVAVIGDRNARTICNATTDFFENAIIHVFTRSPVDAPNNPKIMWYIDFGTMDMFYVLKRCHYMFAPMENVYVNKITSGAINVAFGALCQLIVPSSWKSHKLTSPKFYDDLSRLNVLGYPDINSVLQERQKLVSCRNSIYDAFFDIRETYLVG